MIVRPWVTAAAALVLVVSACAISPAPAGPVDPGPDRTDWRQQLTVVETTDLRITARSASRYGDAIEVRLGANWRDTCSASISAPGQGGPENVVGEQLETTYRGRPALRNGDGAESDYLMWQLADDRWVRVDCDSTELVDRVAPDVRTRPSSLRIPFELSIPSDYRPVLLTQNPDDRSATVYLDRPDRQDATIAIRLDGLDPMSSPGDPAPPINKHPTWIGTDERSPSVHLLVQDQSVHVYSDAGDTGPYPDRSADRPILLALATDLTFADDLTDPSTWFPAEDVFG